MAQSHLALVSWGSIAERKTVICVLIYYFRCNLVKCLKYCPQISRLRPSRSHLSLAMQYIELASEQTNAECARKGLAWRVYARAIISLAHHRHSVCETHTPLLNGFCLFHIAKIPCLPLSRHFVSGRQYLI